MTVWFRSRTAALALLPAAALLTAALGQSLPPRRSFEIATGPASSMQFQVGEAIAGAVSHPPGLARCEHGTLCGPPGVIVSARSSDGAIANILAVEVGQVSSGIAESSVVANAVAGKGLFHKIGKQGHVRVVADLFGETVYLVASARSPIKTVSQLKGRRVSLGSSDSGTESIANAILNAYGVTRWRGEHLSDDVAAAALGAGKLDAFFVVGRSIPASAAALIARGEARLVAIRGGGRSKLLRSLKGFSVVTLPGKAPLETLSCRVVWIVSDTVPDDNIYALLRALYHPSNRAFLQQRGGLVPDVKSGMASGLTALPLHPGALRFYRDAGLLPRS